MTRSQATPESSQIITLTRMLELAAKAAGFVNWTWRGESLFVETGHSRGNTGYHWNPLKDDGDALRLAVKLDLWPARCRATSDNWEKTNLIRVVAEVKDMPVRFDEVFIDDPYAATRRAIVRAAAAIGKEMK